MGGWVSKEQGVALIQNGHGDIEIQKGKLNTTLTHNCHFKQTSLFVALYVIHTIGTFTFHPKLSPSDPYLGNPYLGNWVYAAAR